MVKCWFCGNNCKPDKVQWSGRMENCCPKCFKLWYNNDVAGLFEKLKDKMDREVPLPSDYKLRRRDIRSQGGKCYEQ